MPDTEERQPSNSEDLDLVSQVLSGNTNAFRRLVEKYQGMIFRLCRSYLKNSHDAEDAAQDVFLRAYKSLSTFRLDKRFSTWLYTIGINVLKKRYAKIKRLPTQAELNPETVTADTKEPDEKAEREAIKVEINAGVRKLPEKLRDVTILYYLEEKSVTEITEILEIGPENVKSRLHRARKKLREILEKTQPSE